MTTTHRIHLLQVTARVTYALRLANAKDVHHLPTKAIEALWRDQRKSAGLRPAPLGTLDGIGMQPLASVRTRQINELASMQAIAREVLAQASAGDVTVTFEGEITLRGSEIESLRGASTDVFRIALAWSLMPPNGV